MKKQLLLLAGSALILASCGSNNTNQNQQAQIDSMAKVNAAMQDATHKAKNDSTINAMAKAKADSMEMADKSKHHEGGHKSGHNSQENTSNTPPPVTPPPAGMKGHSDQNQNNPNNTGQKQGGGMRSHSDQNQGK